jgi:hypothetical protein
MSIVVFDNNEHGLSLVKPDSLFALTLESYANTLEDFQVQILTFGVMIACLTFWLRYTYFNIESKWLSFSKKMIELIRPEITSLRCLFAMWCMPTFKCAFDLDMLKYVHQLGYSNYSARKLQMPYTVEITQTVSFTYYSQLLK